MITELVSSSQRSNTSEEPLSRVVVGRHRTRWLTRVIGNDGNLTSPTPFGTFNYRTSHCQMLHPVARVFMSPRRSGIVSFRHPGRHPGRHHTDAPSICNPIQSRSQTSNDIASFQPNYYDILRLLSSPLRRYFASSRSPELLHGKQFGKQSARGKLHASTPVSEEEKSRLESVSAKGLRYCGMSGIGNVPVALSPTQTLLHHYL